MIPVDIQNVVELRDRPERPERAVTAIVHGVFAPQAVEVIPVGVLLEDVGVREVDVLKGDGIWVRNEMGVCYVHDVKNKANPSV